MTVRAIAAGVLTGLLAGAAAAAPPEAERPPRIVERPSKPTGPIAIDHRLLAEPAVGIPLTIVVTARAAGAVTLSIEATPTEPRTLQISAPVLAGTEAGRFEWTIAVVPLASDAGFVNVLVTGTIDGVDQARSVAIPLRVAAVPVGVSPVDAEGENLISLPVDEAR